MEPHEQEDGGEAVACKKEVVVLAADDDVTYEGIATSHLKPDHMESDKTASSTSQSKRNPEE